MLNIDEDRLKLLLQQRKNKIEKPKLNGIGEIISGVTTILTLFLSDFDQGSFINPLYFQLIAWIIALVILGYGLWSLISSIRKFYSVENLYSEIADIDPKIEHAFSIVLIRNKYESGKFLLFHSERWKCWLFPNYRCSKTPFNLQDEIKCVIKQISRDLRLSGNIKVLYLGNIESHKFSFGDKVEKKYKFYFFEISYAGFLHNSYKGKFCINGKKYRWNTLDQMYSNKNMVKKNQDVMDYVREKCDMS